MLPYIIIQLALAGDEDDEDDTDVDDYSASVAGASSNTDNRASANISSSFALSIPQTPHMKRQLSDNGLATAGVTTHKKRKLVHTNLLAKFAQPSFPMFESQEVSWTVDDFGSSNDDLVFHDIDPSAKHHSLRYVGTARKLSYSYYIKMFLDIYFYTIG